MSDVYGMTVTEEERAATQAAAAADECSAPECKAVMEKPGRGAAARPVLHMCDKHKSEHAERHMRAMADYRESQRVKSVAASEGAVSAA